MTTKISDELEFAIHVATTAGKETLKWFRNTDLSVDSKSDGSPVTLADKKAEEIARELLEKEFPNDSIWGEEFGETNRSSERVWAIDPIDGTRSFISGVPTYSTLIALSKHSDSALDSKEWDLGVIFIPALDELIYASIGNGCWFVNADKKKTQAQVSQTKKLEQAKIVASGANYVPSNIIQTADIFRTWGDGYGYMLLATGMVDLMLDIDLSVWDYAPLKPIITESGGQFLEWKNAPTENIQRTARTIDRVATNTALTEDLQNYLELEV